MLIVLKTRITQSTGGAGFLLFSLSAYYFLTIK
jgi:hypothetical protein